MFVNKLFCLSKLGLRRVVKIDFKTDKWKSDLALERIKNMVVLVARCTFLVLK